MPDPLSFDTADEAKQYATENGGTYLVLAPEVLAQIRAAEEAGGFEGGMSGAAGEGGFSTGGKAPDTDTAGKVLDGFVLDVSGEEVIERGLDLKDLWEAFTGEPLGPVLLVPVKELRRWAGIDTGPEAYDDVPVDVALAEISAALSARHMPHGDHGSFQAQCRTQKAQADHLNSMGLLRRRGEVRRRERRQPDRRPKTLALEWDGVAATAKPRPTSPMGDGNIWSARDGSMSPVVAMPPAPQNSDAT